jgi:hypothetical protein
MLIRKSLFLLSLFTLLDLSARATSLVGSTTFRIVPAAASLWDISGHYANLTLQSGTGTNLVTTLFLSESASGKITGTAHFEMDKVPGIAADSSVKGSLVAVGSNIQITLTTAFKSSSSPNFHGNLAFKMVVSPETSSLQGTVSGSFTYTKIASGKFSKAPVSLSLPVGDNGAFTINLQVDSSSPSIVGSANLFTGSNSVQTCQLSGSYNDIQGRGILKLLSPTTNSGIGLSVSVIPSLHSNILFVLTGKAMGQTINYRVSAATLYAIPCGYSGGTVFGTSETPGSQYANYIIGLACQLGHVSLPAGGIWSVIGLGDAGIYDYLRGRLSYDPNNLNALNYQFGAQEAGDSVLYHETGHHWAFMTGVWQAIGTGTSSQSWNQEYQADSYAGWVLRNLGGNALPSVNAYQTILANWTPTHPPGYNRALVFYNSWYYDQIEYFTPGTFSSIVPLANMNPSPDTQVLLRKLNEATQMRHRIEAAGLNPYSSDSDRLFSRLLNEVRN